MPETNPYLALMEDEEPSPRKKQLEKPKEKPVVSEDLSAPMIAPAWATTNDGVPVQSEEQNAENKNPYEDLLEDGDHENGLPYNAVSGVMTPGVQASRKASDIAETLSGAPSGSVAEIKALMNPSKPAMTVPEASQQAAQARVPAAPTVPPAPVEKPLPHSGGEQWLENWADMEKPGFTGGVPEAGQIYQRSKPQGKVSSKLYKKFGNKPLNIAGQAEKNALSEDEALMRVRQALYEHQMHKSATEKAQLAAAERAALVEKEAQAAAQASRLSSPLSMLGKILGIGGAGLGAYDAYRRLHEENDKRGAALALGTTAATAAAPIAGPLSAAAMGLYDDPEARKKFVNAMQPEGAWQKRMESRFGLD